MTSAAAAALAVSVEQAECSAEPAEESEVHEAAETSGVAVARRLASVPSPPPLPPPPCEERDVARPSQRTVARLFELLPQRERDRFGAWALQQPYASSATWRDGGAMLARFEWFGWRDLHAAFRDLALPVEPASAVDSRDAGRTRNLWSDVPESGAAAATAPAGREYLDEAECRFRQTALALLAREGDWYYYGSR